MQFAAISNSILAFKSLESAQEASFFINRPSPSFLVVHQNIMYTLSEIDNGSVASYDIAKPNAPLISSKIVKGAPTHVAVSPNGIIGLANYGGGSVTFFLCDYATGQIGELLLNKAFETTKKGPNPDRQDKSHPHEIVFSTTDCTVYVPDLGLDVIHRFDTLDFTREIPPIPVSPGYGPRHMHLEGDLMLVVCELVSKVVVIRNGKIVHESDLLIQETERLRRIDTTAIGLSAEIQVLGDNVYVSQRMVNQNGYLVHFKLNAKEGKLTKQSTYPLTGKSPRQFAINGKQLFVALEDQPFLEIFTINLANGDLGASQDISGAASTGSLSTPSQKAYIGEGQKCVAFY